MSDHQVPVPPLDSVNLLLDVVNIVYILTVYVCPLGLIPSIQGRDVTESDTDGYCSFYICFHIFFSGSEDTGNV
jgi:hypothetical protein